MDAPDYGWDFQGGDLRPSYGTPSAKFEGDGITRIQPGDFSVIPGVMDLVSDPLGGGVVMRSRATGADTPISGGIRSEMQGPAALPAGEYWYLVDLLIPSDFDASDRHWALAQLHDSPDGGDAIKYVNGLLLLKGGHLMFTAAGDAPNENQTGKYLCIVPALRGQWQRWVIQAVWSQTKTGILRGWRNNEQVFCSVGPNAYPDVNGPYLKAGVYDEQGVGGDFERTAYYRTLYCWSGSRAYRNLTGENPTAPTSRMKI